MAAAHPWPAGVSGKISVVTGASRGLGAGLAARFSEAGLGLGLCARSDPTGWNAPRGAVARSVDVTDEAAVDRFCGEVIDTLGPIDLWINNAGLLEPIAPLRDCAVGEVARLFEVNALGTAIGSRAFIRHRRSVGGGGVLVNIASGAGRSAYAGWAPYCASKAAVDALTECIAIEEGEIGLRVHSVAPGVIDTDMQATIRNTPAERFPAVGRFLSMKEEDDFFSPAYVADWLLDLAFDPARDQDGVRLRVPPPATPASEAERHAGR